MNARAKAMPAFLKQFHKIWVAYLLPIPLFLTPLKNWIRYLLLDTPHHLQNNNIMENPILFSLLLSVGLNFLVFLLAFKLQTDKLTDITYSATFVLLAAYFWTENSSPTHPFFLFLFLMPIVWAIRLGSYLFRRVLIKGRDHRFDEMRPVFIKFGAFWLLQAISVWIIALPFILALNADLIEANKALNSPLLPIGFFLWLVGFLIETIADYQKFHFRQNPQNNGRFMSEGLFSIVRFPNYLGEMLVWVGIFVAIIPILQSWEWLSIISPLWICFLLLKVSGIPYLEASNEKRYGAFKEFQIYKKSTKKIIPGVY